MLTLKLFRFSEDVLMFVVRFESCLIACGLFGIALIVLVSGVATLAILVAAVEREVREGSVYVD